jgi:hypothetical protein
MRGTAEVLMNAMPRFADFPIHLVGECSESKASHPLFVSLAEKCQTSGRKGMRGKSLRKYIPSYTDTDEICRCATHEEYETCTWQRNSIAAINFMNRFGVMLAPMEYHVRTAKHFSLTAVFRHGRSTEKEIL